MGARFILALVISLPIAGFAQTFNGNFETLEPNGIPTAWKIADPSGAATSSDGYLGKHCAKAWVYKNFESGIWSSNSSLTDANASEVTGYYKYLGEKSECDKATVSYLLGAKSATGAVDTLAFGATELKLSKEYRKFELSVDAVNSGQPSFMTMQIMPAGHCNEHGQTNCCFLYVDDIIRAGATTVAPTAPVQEDKGDIDAAGDAAGTEEVPTEKGRKSKKQKEEVPTSTEEAGSETEKTAAPVEEAPVEEAVPAKEGKGGATDAPVETPAEEESESSDEGEAEPLEGWESEESSSDGGLR
jgi:hypothetical protein